MVTYVGLAQLKAMVAELANSIKSENDLRIQTQQLIKQELEANPESIHY